ncbi:uncharacterized protein LOC119074250 [Bradysia coprophila]|uniref:uncharacterized protein LOC119074250 n=1 Tax=Bradysia coprophila TaxID=38358 RepID=UPI00187D98C9|nr:uncharacterized protein LOC119074250 [Bradysia coprophila]
MQKLLICAVFCVTLSSIVESAAVNAIWGTRIAGDERLLYKIVKQENGWFFTKAVEDVDFPGKGAYSTGNITYIEAINQKPGSGSSVTILKGGIGFPFVKLHFKSTRTEGYDYVLQIFGKLNNAPVVRPPQPQPYYPPPYPQPQPQPYYPQPGYPARNY